MDAQRFDALVRSLTASGRRREVLGFLATLPLLGGLLTLLDEETEGKGRRKRRKKGHKHAQGDGKKNRKGKRKRKNKGKGKGEEHCQPESAAQTCEGKCGTVQNTCQKPVDCDPCDCDPPCGACETCTNGLVCEPCDPCCDDVCCFQANAVCHADGGGCCMPDSTAQTCKNQCGDIVNNCGIAVDCGPCTCGGGCPECNVCNEETDACDPDPTQGGDACGAEGQVCQANGNCACDAGSCPDCSTCENSGFCAACSDCCDGGRCVASCGDCHTCADGQCVACADCCDGGTCVATCPSCQLCDSGACIACPDCCDADGVCQDGTTNAACGSSGACEVCAGQDECQNQQCVCVPDCDGMVCGSDGCNGQCPPDCPANASCSGDGTACTCDFVTCDSSCCAEDESCCGTDCTETDSDPDNCGACGNVCDLGLTCQDGVCGVACGSDFCSAATEICDGGTCRACDVCATCTHTTVQAAINGANSGDTVRICAGTYTRFGNGPVAEIIGIDLTLVGAAAESTILDGGGFGSSSLDPVLFVDVSTSTVRQLTVTGGNDASGILTSEPTNLTLADVIVSGNRKPFGAGIENRSVLTLDAGTIVRDNFAERFSGGGILNAGDVASLTLNAGARVTGNLSVGTGGGIANVVGITTLNAGSEVSGNVAFSQTGAGGITNDSGGTVILQPGSRVCGNSNAECEGFADPNNICQDTCP